MTSPTDPAGSAPAAEAGNQPGLSAAIEPDEKDWTWVLRHPCHECGFDVGTVSGRQVAAGLRAHAVRWSAVLHRADVRARPEPQVWSPLEYGCHVRDVCRVFERRVNLMRLQVDPAFENWDQDATAVADDYGAHDPSAVSAELSAAAEAAAAAFETVTDGDWERTGRRSNGSVFTIETLGQYILHDVAHHLHDVRG